jgi:hypothetical protein
MRLNITLSFDDIVNALKHLSPQKREELLENLQAATSPSYRTSVREARAEYRAGRTYTHKEVFKNRARTTK